MEAIRTLVPPKVREALIEVLEYHWNEEEAAYRDKEEENHIFLRLQLVRRWLELSIFIEKVEGML